MGESTGRTPILVVIVISITLLMVGYQNCSNGFQSLQPSQSGPDIAGPSPGPGPTPTPTPVPTPTQFSFSREITGAAPQLSVHVSSPNSTTGEVVMNGAVFNATGAPRFNWGDGTFSEGYFLQSHVYADRTRNYVVEVTSNHSNGATETQKAIVRFVSPSPLSFAVNEQLRVTVPSQTVTLNSRGIYSPPTNLVPFADNDFNVVPRSIVAQVLTASAQIEHDLINRDVLLVNGAFQQVVLKANGIGGGFSVWFSNPVALAMGSQNTDIPWSSMIHEMGHNLSLNFPAAFIYGGKIDGNANAIYSEGVAQILQHATIQILLTNPTAYGLTGDLATEIELSGRSSMSVVRRSYDSYVSGGSNYSSWNDPNTQPDETFNTFMTVAFKFFQKAEQNGNGYRIPTKRFFALLSLFDAEMQASYSAQANSATGSEFRSTLMVAALSFAFDQDLRSEFRALNFPVNDSVYSSLIQRAAQKWATVSSQI